MSKLKYVLMDRDGFSSEEADQLITQMREQVMDGEDPEEVLYNEVGLEPDYVFDIM